MKNDKDFSRIISSDGKLIGVLNFNLMIPVASEVEFLGERPKELINETKNEVDVDLTPIPNTELPF